MRDFLPLLAQEMLKAVSNERLHQNEREGKRKDAE